MRRRFMGPFGRGERGVESRAMASTRVRALIGLAALAATGPLPSGASESCDEWPGEPSPLPDVTSSDSFAARWARLRLEELRGLAILLEAADPVEAQRVWRHAACLAPEDPAISEALARTVPVAVHRPAVEPGPVAPVRRATTLRSALALLDAPARVPVGPETDFASVDAQLDEATGRLEQARFRDALALCDLIRGRMVRMGDARGAHERRARVELLAATVHLALGEEPEARSCVERALRAQPELALDPARSPRKLVRLVDDARLALARRSG
jgi:hypothetical protein